MCISRPRRGVAQAVFPEGGLTRDGSLRPPKLGLLSYMVSGFDPQGAPRHRVRAGRPQLRPRAGGPHPDGGGLDAEGREAALRVQSRWCWPAFWLRSLWLRLRGRWHRYGYACVSFGNPMSLRAYLAERGVDLRALPAEQRFAEIERLGNRLMHEVGRVVPALPVSLVATAILDGGERGLSGLEIKGAVFELMETLKGEGAHVHIPRQDQEYAVEVGLRMLLMRHLVRARGRRLPRQCHRKRRCCASMPTPSRTCWSKSRRHQRRRLAAA